MRSILSRHFFAVIVIINTIAIVAALLTLVAHK